MRSLQYIFLVALLGIIGSAGCRVVSPQPTLREGAYWFPPTFPYLRGTFQQRLNIRDHGHLQLPDPRGLTNSSDGEGSAANDALGGGIEDAGEPDSSVRTARDTSWGQRPSAVAPRSPMTMPTNEPREPSYWDAIEQ